MAKYLLRITASDGKFQVAVIVEIFVLDINDNSPQCSQVRAWWGGAGGSGSKEAGAKGKRKEKDSGDHLLGWPLSTTPVLLLLSWPQTSALGRVILGNSLASP